MGAMSPWHWAIVALVVVILFGSKKLPDAARGLGRSLRIFKSEVSEMQNDSTQNGNTAASTAPDAAGPAELAVADTATIPVPQAAPIGRPDEVRSV
ncbi:hypothetical protein RQCS_58380 (plasmid) [Rhodococcus qingshengii]|uniref:Sec-independent protein translocase subunit TatA n=1 Tax=Rhodococcus qingshengii TaxID=334542 RepID=UPI0007E57469|nr:Sec-independent protein translocase subunit TatA [Rhodococcus qingshengii]BCF86293.1 hypothetical protein RQCS_58380 [Rhodococcus qingshengii]